ncbi:uncharacterized protein EAE98_004214 [Botrytis deweyae]|uniref:Carboxylesterase type B domain-containing protein n=1 Tax=Botrytis deweyae TaxID=2478750 RepID=A0ABQ7IQN7_9HELO|nr:uncharacterized protein EAE98_004214 [Botrytis deweyae]KAF7931478.1 hypothetical protein EAE98_004214 [Botrytis deweyae]
MKLLNIFAFIITSVEASEGGHHGRPFQPSRPSLRPPPTFPRPHPKNTSIPGPIVDLGYERHQAIFNSTGHYNNFSNIPYAIPPLQDLRFSKPLPINSTSSHINDGSIGHICPQARPDWTEDAGLLVALYTLGLINNIDPSHLKPNPFEDVPNGWESEDCLLLDVVVPEGVAEAVEEDDDFVPLPVMVWIHGGGFTFGHKNQDGSPYGFLNASTFTSESVAIHDSIIFVTLNYRLGAFGFLSTPDNSTDPHPTPNAGLYDQALALNWVSQHISKFGGDPDRVTVIGESAGASSILHHITSYGGSSSSLNPDSLPRAPFQRAILQSPAFFPAADADTELEAFDDFLFVARADTFEELKNKPEEVLISANKLLVSKSPYAQFTFGPTLDTIFIPKPVSVLLRDGDFWDDIDGIMVAHNSLEGLLFTDIKAVENDDTFATFIRNSLPGLKDEDLEYIVKDLYPLDDENAGVLDKLLRGANATAELSTICNAVYLLDAFGAEGSYKYVFGVEPGVHGQDVGFSFYQKPPSDPADIYNTGKVLPSTEIVAQTLQAYIVGFVKEGDPNRGLIGPEFPVYKDGIVILGSKENGSMIVPEGEVRVEEDLWVDVGTRERCKWWGEARYWDGYEGGDDNDGNDGSDGDKNGDDGNEDDGNENEDDDTQSSLKVHTSHKTIPRPLKNWRNNPSSSQLQNADSITPTFSDIFKTRNDGKKVEWHAEWKSDWMGNSEKAFANTEGSDIKGKESEIEEKEELR